MMITRKKVINYYFIIIGIFAIVFIAISGNSKTNIVTSNVHNVKSILSTRIVKQNDIVTKTNNSTSINLGDVKSNTLSNPKQFNGTLTGYGADCEGCSGIVACSPYQNVKNNNIYYNDKEYGKVRILAADKSIPCGSIVHIENFKFVDNNEFIGIVLDRGSAIVGNTMDLLYPTENDTVKIGRQKNISFNVIRWGWKSNMSKIKQIIIETIVVI